MSTEPDTSDLLVRAGHALRRRWMASLEPWNVSPHEFRALRAVTDLAPARLTDLADRLRIANRSATEVVDSLESKGLVHRAPSPTDRRAVVVTLSEQGQRLTAELAQARSTAGVEFLAPLTDADRETLRELLARLLDETAEASRDREDGKDRAQGAAGR